MLNIDGIIFSLQSHGGISVYFREILRHLNFAEVKYQVLLYGRSALNRVGFGVNSTLLPHRLAERYRSGVVLSDCSLFHSSYYRIPERAGVPLVTTVHDFTYEKYRALAPRSLHSWQKNRAITAAQGIICVSNNTKMDLLHYLPDVDQRRIFVIPNGVGDAFRPLGSPDIVGALSPYVLYVGGRGGYKNFTRAVYAVHGIPSLRLICVGGGSMSPKERALVDKCLGNRFELRLGVDDDTLNVLYNNAVCLLYPSSYEGFGIPVLEAMKAGCPVVAINASSVPEVAGNAAILVEAPDVCLLAKAVEEASQPLRRKEIISLGLERAALFSWGRTFRETLEVYKSLGLN